MRAGLWGGARSKMKSQREESKDEKTMITMKQVLVTEEQIKK